MLICKASACIISAVVLFIAVAAENSERTRRQAPNINVHQIPKTSFSCDNRKVGDYYADPEANCQVYHVCVPGMHNRMSLISFVCPNGTIFSQATRVCTPYERVDCRLTTQFYDTVHGDKNSRRSDYANDNDFETYEAPPPPREPAAPRTRNTPPPTSPPAQPQRNNRFRGSFRGQQAPPATTPAPAPARATTAAPARPAPARPAPAFRPPVLPVRPVQPVASNVLPPRATPRPPAVTTSTEGYSYEYEYEYDYEDEDAGQGPTRTRREAAARDQDGGFDCRDKVAGAAYADLASGCRAFHICVPMGTDAAGQRMLDYKVACAAGTAFDQEAGACREKGKFRCENKGKPTAPSKKPVFKKKFGKS